ncbi:MAG: hypothetical protein HOJ22_01995 [Chloroflexi bacterium]|nr:hypothetical protein [Chloroflexota bacterium]MBT5627036.1 hypothetical protein [Chloroflexota bacterium]
MSRRSITLTLVLIIGLAVAAWFVLSRDGAPRNVEALDILALDFETRLEEERDGIHVFRGNSRNSGYIWVVSILYSESMTGEEIVSTDHFDVESAWLNETYEIEKSPLPYRIVQNSVVICWREEGCDFVAGRLEQFTN